MLGSNSGFASSSQADSASRSLEDHVEVHTENTGEGVILNTEIDVLLNTKSKTSSIRKIGFSELSIFNFKSSFENFVGFISSDGDVSSDFLISFNTEASDSKSSS